MVSKKVIGLLTLLVAATYIIITLEGQFVRLKIGTGSTTFYTQEGGVWVTAGVEVFNLYNGTKKLTKNETTLFSTNISGMVWVLKTTKYPSGQVINQFYYFNASNPDVRNFPIKETVEVLNANGMILRYDATKLVYSGTSYKLRDETELTFGRSIKIEFPSGYSSGNVYSSGGVRLNYKITSNSQEFRFRMYDPPVKIDLYTNGTWTNKTIESNEPINITAKSNVTNLTVCLSVNHSYLGENFTCNETGTIMYYWNPTCSILKFNDSTTSKNVNFTTTANQTVYYRFHSEDEVNLIKINLTGINTSGSNWPANVKVFLNNTLVALIPGQLKEGTSTLNNFNDSSTAKNFTFSHAGSQSTYLKLAKNAVVIDATLNVSGYNNTNGTWMWGYTNDSIYYNPELSVDNNLSTNSQILLGGYANFYENVSAMAGLNWSVMVSYCGASGTTSGNVSFWNYTSGAWQLLINMNCGGFCNYTAVIPSSAVSNYIMRLKTFTHSDATTYCSYWDGWIPGGMPANNPYIDVESDGDMEWNWTGTIINTNNKTGNFSSSLNHYLTYCTQDSYGNCNIPIVVGLSSGGIPQLGAINITYNINFNPITISASTAQAFLNSSSYGFVNMPITIEANQGNVSINGTNISYNGSCVLNVTASWAGNATYPAASNVTYLNITRSKFTLRFPYSFMIEPIFLPLTNSSKNVSMYGQSSTVPGYNITGKNYAINFNVSIRLNQSMNSCMNMTVGTSNSVYNFTLNTTRRQILSNISYNQSAGLWLKLNMYNCSSSYVYRDWWIELDTCCMTCMRCW